MIQPPFPLIAISNDGSLNLVPGETYFSKVATSALIDPAIFDQTMLFDSSGNKWTHRLSSDKFNNSFLTRLLAKTFYNPLLDAKVVWIQAGTYPVDELKEKLKDCVDKDDDIITQFEEPDIIKSAINNAIDFADILKVLNKYVFAVNEHELFKEQESSTGRAASEFRSTD